MFLVSPGSCTLSRLVLSFLLLSFASARSKPLAARYTTHGLPLAQLLEAADTSSSICDAVLGADCATRSYSTVCTVFHKSARDVICGTLDVEAEADDDDAPDDEE